jgi:phosphoribosylformylglycinamidine cyclo-ligase
VLFERHHYAIDQRVGELDATIGQELLKPTYIYVKESLKALKTVPGIKALVHITSDGLGNLARLRPSMAYVIDNLPPIPPIFELIQRLGRVSDDEMFLVYNMGIGFCYITDELSADVVIDIVRDHGKEALRIGHVESSPKKQVRIPARNLVLNSFRKLPNCPS